MGHSAGKTVVREQEWLTHHWVRHRRDLHRRQSGVGAFWGEDPFQRTPAQGPALPFHLQLRGLGRELAWGPQGPLGWVGGQASWCYCDWSLLSFCSISGKLRGDFSEPPRQLQGGGWQGWGWWLRSGLRLSERPPEAAPPCPPAALASGEGELVGVSVCGHPQRWLRGQSHGEHWSISVLAKLPAESQQA